MARNQLTSGRQRSTSRPCSRPTRMGWSSVGEGYGRLTLARLRRRVQVADGGVHLLLDAGQGDDVEHGLAVAEDVDELVAVAGEDRPAAVQHEVGGGEVLAEVLAEVLDGRAGLLQRHAGVEEALD